MNTGMKSGHKERKVILMLLASALALSTAATVHSADRNSGTEVLAVRAKRGAVLEPGEQHPGGNATTRRSLVNRDAFSQPSEGIGFEGESKFRIGNSIFRRLWVSAPSSTDSSDGLGPLYNARGCQNCHLKDGRGHPPNANWPDDDAVSMLMRISIPPQTDDEKRQLAEDRIKSVDEPVYGGQLQDLSIQGHDIEGRIYIDYSNIVAKLAGGRVVTLRKPSYRVGDLTAGPLHPETMMSVRVAPQMIGLGLLEAIPEDHIRANADPEDANGDGISGRANEVWSIEHDKVMLGRFGWKAGSPTVRQQSAEAFAGDIGLSTPLVRKSAGDCTKAQSTCLAAPNGDSARKDGAEVSRELFDLVAFYAQNLAVPPRRNADRADVLRGKSVFHSLGCAACHVPSHKTGDLEGQPHLSRQIIWPYTDLLLHDMGEGLADNRPEGRADGREWRTPPLWGIGLTEAVSRHSFFLHDGRARNLEEAILWHGGEAEKARNNYAKSRKADRESLITFLKSL
jgi:CxxC motif-containing protein (DUF1111 family)